ncbi:MAG: hypothetical protein HY921_03535 [Elusimicrobia bacterium]|nr:hypothetical protein [Elusimicrobiota bacterium]
MSKIFTVGLGAAVIFAAGLSTARAMTDEALEMKALRQAQAEAGRLSAQYRADNLREKILKLWQAVERSEGRVEVRAKLTDARRALNDRGNYGEASRLFSDSERMAQDNAVAEFQKKTDHLQPRQPRRWNNRE